MDKIGQFLHDAYLLSLRQGIIYEAITLVLVIAAIGTGYHILKLYVTRAHLSGISAKEQARISADIKRKQARRNPHDS
jgi:hypothetical protein